MARKLFILVGLYGFTLLTGLSQSQIHYRFGITAGPNAALVQNSFGLKSIMWQYNVGLTLEQRFSSTLSMAYALIYSRQGETINGEHYLLSAGQTIKTKQTFNFDYISLPVLLQFQPKDERAFIEVGGQIGYMVYNQYQYSDPPSAVQSGELAHTQPWDAGLSGGIGYRFSKHVVIDSRYYYGIKSITADFIDVDKLTGATAFIHTQKWYNRVYSLNLSYYF